MSIETTEPRDLRSLRNVSSGISLSKPAYPWKTRLLIPLALGFSIAGLLGYSARQKLLPVTDVRVVPVVLKSASETQAGGIVVQAAGWVEADPYAISVTALTDGIVKEVLVLEGQSVEKGQVVARLIDDDARLELARSQAELDKRAADLVAAVQQWENPTDRTRAVAVAEARVAAIKAQLDKLTHDTAVEAAKVEDLVAQFALVSNNYQKQAASEVEYVTLKARLDGQKSTLESIKSSRFILEAQQQESVAELAASQTNLKLRIEESNALAAAKAAEAYARAMRDESQLKLDRMAIRSWVSGVVLSRHVEPGAKMMLGMDERFSSTAVRVYDPEKLQVRVDVPLADASKIGVGMVAEVVVGVLPDRTFKGVVSRIVNEADLQKNTLQVKVAIKDPVPQLKPEMLARVKFISSATTGGSGPSQAVFAPVSLVSMEGETAHVWVVDRSDNVAVRREVVMGSSRQSGWVSIRSGLSAGDQLITDVTRLRDGSRVRVVGEADLPQEVQNDVH